MGAPKKTPPPPPPPVTMAEVTSAIDAVTNPIKGKITDLGSKITTIETQMGKFKSDISTLGDQVAKVDTRIRRLNSTLSLFATLIAILIIIWIIGMLRGGGDGTRTDQQETLASESTAPTQGESEVSVSEGENLYLPGGNILQGPLDIVTLPVGVEVERFEFSADDSLSVVRSEIGSINDDAGSVSDSAKWVLRVPKGMRLDIRWQQQYLPEGNEWITLVFITEVINISSASEEQEQDENLFSSSKTSMDTEEENRLAAYSPSRRDEVSSQEELMDAWEAFHEYDRENRVYSQCGYEEENNEEWDDGWNWEGSVPWRRQGNHIEIRNDFWNPWDPSMSL